MGAIHTPLSTNVALILTVSRHCLSFIRFQTWITTKKKYRQDGRAKMQDMTEATDSQAAEKHAHLSIQVNICATISLIQTARYFD